MKRKMFRTLIAGLLAASMLTGMVACGNQDDGSSQSSGSQGGSQGGQSSTPSSGSSEPSSQEEDLGPYTVRKDANGNPVDLGGITVCLRDWNTDPNAATSDGSAYSEAREAYRQWVQDTYNFTFEQKAISTYESTPEDFVNYVTEGGDDNYYIFMLYTGPETLSAMTNGLMYDVSTLDCFDLSDGKWHTGVSDMFSIGNKIYGFRINEGVGGRGVYFNKRILADAGYKAEDLYKWQDAGEWTWDKFEEICKAAQKDTDNDGTPDVYGMAVRNTIWYEIITHTNNGAFIKMDANGKLVNALEDANTMEALNWALDMWDTYDAHPSYPEDAAWDYFITAYKEAKACFYPGELWRANDFTNSMDDELGFVCFPKGPKGTDYVNPVADNPTVIPACYDADKAWKIMFALDVLNEPVPEYEDYASWKADGYNNFDDTESVDSTVAILMSHPRATLNSLVSGLDLAGDIFYVISKDNTPAQIAESVRNKWQGLLDTANGDS